MIDISRPYRKWMGRAYFFILCYYSALYTVFSNRLTRPILTTRALMINIDANRRNTDPVLTRPLGELFAESVVGCDGDKRLQALVPDISPNHPCDIDITPKHSPSTIVSSKLRLSIVYALLLFTTTAYGIPIEQDANSISTSSLPAPLPASLSETGRSKGPGNKTSARTAEITLLVIAVATLFATLLSICTRRVLSSIRQLGTTQGRATAAVLGPAPNTNAIAPGIIIPTNTVNPATQTPLLPHAPPLHTTENANGIRAVATVSTVYVYTEAEAEAVVRVAPLDADATLKDFDV